MAESRWTLEERRGRFKVHLRVPMHRAAQAAEALALPAQVSRWSGSEPQALALAPDQWLLVSDEVQATEIIARCASGLDSLLHAALDISASLASWQLAGPAARTLLGMGTGVDLDARSFPAGHCARVRFAGIALIIVALEEERLDLHVDRGYSDYLRRWFERAGTDPLIAAG